VRLISADDKGAGLDKWATCIAVLFSAVIKLSGATQRDPTSGMVVDAVMRVWRGVDETRGRELPPSFYDGASSTGSTCATA
jgi:hypothetical protein